MDNSVKKLITMLEPLVFDLEDQKNLLENRKNELENVSRFVAYTKDDVDKVSVYADQNMIINNLSKIYCDKDTYKASCYLLQSEDESVKSLPQYKKAHELVGDIVELFKLYKSELVVETQDIKKICEKKEIEKKYYEIFKNKDPFVEEVFEFKEMLDSHNVSTDDKIALLLYTIKSNLKRYEESK